jgi:hypothetical protein
MKNWRLIILTLAALGLSLFALGQGYTLRDLAFVGNVSPAAGSSFTYYSASFTTSQYLKTAGDLTGSVDGKAATISFWMKMDAASDDATVYLIFGHWHLSVRRNSDTRIFIQAQDSGGVDVMTIDTTISILKTTGWHHVLVSFDTGTAGRQYIYIDGVDQSHGQFMTVDGITDFVNGQEFVIGARHDYADKYYGLLCEAWFTESWLDITQQSNRELFRTPGGKPADLGADGIVGGLTPLIYLKTAVPNFENNTGTGGSFTEVGTIVDGGADKP